MKTLIRRFCLLSALTLSLSPTFSQDRNNEDEVVKIDSRVNRNEFVENEVLVKFSKNVKAKVAVKGLRAQANISAVDKLLSGYEVEQMEQLLPNEKPVSALRSARAYNGQEVTESDLSQLYRMKLKAGSAKTAPQLIDELKALPEVEFAEPNYIVTVLGEPSYTEEPMYGLQWGLPVVGLAQLWLQPKTDKKRPVIAILDTGVDISHPDLSANIWTNIGELGHNEGQDDDANGFLDDLHGWDFVNNSGVIRDYNSHGTHCAGIAAATGTNGVGITGANPDAYIMPVTVMQSSGKGDIATIIKGISYAVENGATVISMSFGTYSYSSALKQALAKAYQSAVLVAAAGNDGKAIDPLCRRPNDLYGQMFPAAFSFVLGVQATQSTSGPFGLLTSWSNYDCDGSTFSSFGEEEQYNYELQAPGSGIISTVPGGQYRTYNGTSMAAPLVAGGISALQQRKHYASQEELWGDLIHTAGSNVDFIGAFNASTPNPLLNFVTIELNDSISGDKDNRPDAGETLSIFPTIRNTWGFADSIRFSLSFAEFEDTSLVEILNQDVSLGYSLSSYGKMKSKNPIQIKIGKNVVDGRDIEMILTAWYGDHKGAIIQKITLNVENGVELRGMLSENTTLYPDKHYIITDNLAIPSGVTLTIKPGTVLKFKDGAILSSSGKIVAFGKPDSMITFTKTDLGTSWGGVNFGYADSLDYCILEFAKMNYLERKVKISNSILRNNYYGGISGGNISKTNIYDECYEVLYYLPIFNNTNFSNNTCRFYKGVFRLYSMNIQQSNVYSNFGFDRQTPYTFFDDSTNPILYSGNNNNYYGSSVESIARKGIFDFETTQSGVFGKLDLSNRANRPNAEAHGIVWKVVVNGYDAQDQFDQLPPLGVGRHKFEIYFNRPMNKAIAPFISMGIRPPYTQSAIAEDGSWNETGDIYTVYRTIYGYSTGDGLNRIYVSDAQDNEFFEIPYENMRFNAIVQAAGSMSNGFEAIAGLGKVLLKWEKPDGFFNDLLGYNMYRYTVTDEGISSETVCINKSLINDTIFTDFDVNPGQRYNYMYKVMRTDLNENDPSKVVSATALTASKGDANGSLSVDVADIVTTVNYITGQNPQPFIFDAADVNSDVIVNVLDVVGIVNLILYPTSSHIIARSASSAVYTVENGVLYVETPVDLAGVQVTLKANRESSTIKALNALSNFEQASQWKSDNEFLLMAYSLSGKIIPAGKTALLQIGENTEINQLILSDPHGLNVITVDGKLGNIAWQDGNQIQKVYPNPFVGELHIPYTIGSNSETKVKLVFSDLLGRVVGQYETNTSRTGNYEYVWSPANKTASGIYFCSLQVNGKTVQTVKLVLQR
jgi:Subtilase family/Secretion system C-terminal sorting domain